MDDARLMNPPSIHRGLRSPFAICTVTFTRRSTTTVRSPKNSLHFPTFQRCRSICSPVVEHPLSVLTTPCSSLHRAEGHSIYIQNLPFNATVEQLEEVFKKFGPIKHGGIQVKSTWILFWLCCV